jgi:PAS domain S-box-containing protein
MINSREGIIIPDVDAETVLQNPENHTKRVGACSFIAAPFLQGEKYVGHINCMSKEKNFFSEDDLKLLGALASQANVAIQNARLHEETERNRNFLNSVVSDSAEPISVANMDGEQILWNAAAESLFGNTADEVLGRNYHFIIPEEGLIEATEKWAAVKDSGEATHFETNRKRKDGSFVPVNITLSPVKGNGDEIVAMCAIFNDLTERKKAESEIRKLNEGLEAKVIERTEKLERKSAQISKLNGISRTLSSILGREEVLDQLARDTADLMNGHRAQLFLLSPDRRSLHLEADYTVHSDEPKRDFVIPVRDNPSGIVARHEKSLIIGNLKEDLNWIDNNAIENMRICSYIGVPLYIRGEVAGVLNCLSTEENVFLDDEIELMEALSAHASVALQNVRVFDDLATKSAQISRLNEISRKLSSLLETDEVLNLVVRSAVELLDGDRARFFFLSPDKKRLVPKTSYGVVPEPSGGIPELPVKVNGPPSGVIALNGNPIVIEDVQKDDSWGEPQWAEKEDIHAYIGVPLFLQGRIYGVLNCVSKNVNQFKDIDIILMEALSAQASVALQNALSFHEVAEKSAQVAKLNEINRNLSSYLSQEEVLAQIVKAAEDLIPGSNSNIYLYDEQSHSLKAFAGRNANLGFDVIFSADDRGGMVGWVAKNGESIFIRHGKSDPRWLKTSWNKDSAIGAYSAIPLNVGPTLHGVLVCWMEEEHDWTQGEVDLLNSLASQAAVALENARNFGALS